MKYNAKIAGEHSSELYFLHYVKSKGSLVEKAVVIDAFQASCEVILVTSGYKLQIPYARSHLKVFFGKDKNFNKNSDTYLAVSENSEEKIIVNAFSIIEVVVSVKKEKLHAEIKTSQTGKEQKDEGENSKNKAENKSLEKKTGTTPKTSKLSEEKKAIKKERRKKKGILKQMQKEVAKQPIEKIEALTELFKSTILN